MIAKRIPVVLIFIALVFIVAVVAMRPGKTVVRADDARLPLVAQDAADKSPSKSAATDSAGGMKIEIIGLQVSKPIPSAEDKKANPNLMVQGSMFGMPGTEIHFFLRDKSRAILDIEKDGSQVECTDDKGTNLAAKKEDDRFGFGSRVFSAREAPDSGGTIVEMHQPNTPAAGATKVRVKGELALRCGIGEVVVEQKDVALKAKTSVKAGPIEFVIEEAKEEDFGDTKFVLELKSTKPFDAMKEIEFLDAAGKPIKTQSMGSSSFSAFGKAEYQRGIGLAKKADKVTLRIKHYKTIETVKVPLSLEVGVGF